MADPQQVLSDRVHDAIVASFGPEYGDADPLIRPSSFADFQANVALPLGKRLRRSPREVAAELVARLDVADICAEPEVSGPGFINLTLRDDWIAAQASQMLGDARLGLEPAARPQTVVVEYSSPNVAKEMHVGHLRTTIVGDAIARVLEFAGHRVIRDNHVGDWGTPFGMLIEHLLDVGEDSPEAALLTTDPNAFYQAARRKFDSDPAFTERARNRLVQLQAGDPDTMAIWQRLVDISRGYLHQVYTRLGVSLTDEDIRGESFYNDLLADTVAMLGGEGHRDRERGRAVRVPGGLHRPRGQAAAAHHPQERRRLQLRHHRPGRDPLPGGQAQLRPGDLRGRLRAGAALPDGLRGGPPGGLDTRGRPASSTPRSAWCSARTATGCGPGKARRPSSAACSHEGVDRARGILDEVDAASRFDAAELDAVAEAVGIGAVKYADLSTARESAYLFDWDRMISFRGNTGPYLQYATARIRSIFRRAAEEGRGEAAATPARRGRGDHRGPGAGARAAAARFRRHGDPARRDRGTAPPVRVPVRRGQLVHHVLRGVPGAQGGVRVAAGQPARALRAHAGRAGPGLGLLGVPVPERM